MSNVLCAYSGIEFSVPHFNNLNLYSRECTHPVFALPTSKLLNLVENEWLESKLSNTESYLLYLALFNSTGLLEFRAPAKVSAETTAIVATQMTHLASIVHNIHETGAARVREVLYLPTFVINPDTGDLSSSADWIQIWKQCYADFQNHYKSATELEKLTRKEFNLEKKIKDRNRDISSYAKELAIWAADAGKFPEWDAGSDTYAMVGKRCSLREYWIHIITCCCKLENIWNIPDADIQELTQHCEDEIPHGSIYAATLMSLLRAGADRKRSFFNLGDMNLGTTGVFGFRVLDANASVEDAVKLALIESAPLTEPIESQYPNKIAFIKARMNYRMKKEYDAGILNAAASINTHPNNREGDPK